MLREWSAVDTLVSLVLEVDTASASQRLILHRYHLTA